MTIGRLYQSGQMLGPAQQAFEKSIEIQPSQAALMALSKIYKNRQDLTTANQPLEQALEAESRI